MPIVKIRFHILSPGIGAVKNFLQNFSQLFCRIFYEQPERMGRPVQLDRSKPRSSEFGGVYKKVKQENKQIESKSLPGF
jgi:hypothetical protein